MKSKLIIKALFVILFYCSAFLNAQNSNYFELTLRDSSAVIGQILTEDESFIQIKLINNEEIRLNKSDVLSRKLKSAPEINTLIDSTKNISTNFIEKLDTTETIKIELKDGSTLIGKIDFEDEKIISFNLLSNSKITVEKKSILSREVVTKKIQKGEYWIEDPNKTRLFFAPTGRGLKAGEAYFAIYEVFFPMVSFGVLNYATISVGMSLFPGSTDQLLYFAPKITPFQNEKFAVSIGDFFVKIPESDGNLNIAYSVATFSTQKAAITLGVGYETNSENPIFLLGGEVRISRSSKLITENWFIANTELNFLSFGFRFFGQSLAADFSFVMPLFDDNDSTVFPWIGFAYNF